ncbi:CapA family protein [Microlunatus sp. GCM10028923]|uniref:CapA family protein n=1 Tax=Microlunatus sp. GCM10028923 TaxID=3273400 RepID=UPI003607553E
MRGSWPAALLLVAACAAPAPGPSPESTPSPLDRSTARPAPTSSQPPSPARPRYQVPVVLAVHATHPILDAELAAARAVVEGRADRLTAGGARFTVAGLDRVRTDRSVVAVVPATAVDETVRVLTVDGRHPLRDPVGYPLTRVADRPVGEVTTITITGDLMLARQVAAAHRDDPAAPLRPYAKRLAAAELTVGNLESTLSTDGEPTQGGDSFGADPVVLDGLKLAGFDLVSLANNHVGDYGRAAMLQTFRELDAAKINYVGAGADLARARRPVVITDGDVRIGFVGTESIGETPAATSTRPGTNRLDMPPRTGPLDRRALDRIAADIRALSERVDLVIVIPHWGTQYTHVAESSQRTAARAFAAAGADLIIGGHPHWVQGWEPAGDATVVHSLGNFVFDMDFQTKTREGVFLEIVAWDGEVRAVEPVPYVIDDRFTPRPASPARARSILADIAEHSRGPYARP